MPSTPARSLRPATLCALLVASFALAACSSGNPLGTGGSGSTAGTGGLPTGAPVTDLTKLCDLLGPGDFSAVGISGAKAATVKSDGPGSASCVFAGASAGTGGIELDVFVGDDAEDTFDVVTSEGGGTLLPLPLPWVDEAVGSDGVAGQDDGFGSIVVREGPLVFTIAAPGGPGTAAKLTALAGIVLARAAGLVD